MNATTNIEGLSPVTASDEGMTVRPNLDVDLLRCAGMKDAELAQATRKGGVHEKHGLTPGAFRKLVKDRRKKEALQKERDARQADGEGWRNDLQSDRNGFPLSNLHNAYLMIKNHKALTGLIHYDEMLLDAVITRPIPRVDGRVGKEVGDLSKTRPIEDVDVTHLRAFLQSEGLTTLSQGEANNAVDACASEIRIHPVRDYLDGLVWDGVPRLDRWLATYAGAADNEYTREIGRMFAISMVARIYKPGCKVDNMLVLQGPQGEGKSTLLSIWGGDYFSDHLPDIRDGAKDISQHIKGKWLIEIGEMSAANKATAAAIKAFLTRLNEQYRPSYGRRQVNEPRTCVLAGTTNDNTYLHDETGNRQFWPVSVGTILLDALRRDRDQLFAEAVDRYHKGEKWWPTREIEQSTIKAEQDDRFQENMWQPAVAEVLKRYDEDVTAWKGKGDRKNGVVEVPAVDDEGKPVIDEAGGPVMIFKRDVSAEPEPMTILMVSMSLAHGYPSAIALPKDAAIAGMMRREGWEPARVNKKRFWVKAGA